MKVYTIATHTYEAEHGGSLTYPSIKPMGFYYTGEFPPVFARREDAEVYLARDIAARHACSFGDGGQVVELDFVPPTDSLHVPNP